MEMDDNFSPVLLASRKTLISGTDERIIPSDLKGWGEKQVRGTLGALVMYLHLGNPTCFGLRLRTFSTEI